MKMGVRKPNIKSRVKARTTGKMKRAVKKSVNPLYGKKGMGYINDPKKAVYNKIYNKTTVSVDDVFKSSSSAPAAKNTGFGKNYSGRIARFEYISEKLKSRPEEIEISDIRYIKCNTMAVKKEAGWKMAEKYIKLSDGGYEFSEDAEDVIMGPSKKIMKVKSLKKYMWLMGVVSILLAVMGLFILPLGIIFILFSLVFLGVANSYNDMSKVSNFLKYNSERFRLDSTQD